MAVKESSGYNESAYDGLYGGSGSIRFQDFFVGRSNLPVRFQVWTLAPGVSEGEHDHKGAENLEEIYFVIDGVAEFTMESSTIMLTAGDAIMVPPSEAHGIRNAGETPLKLAVIYGKATGPHIPA